MPEKKKTKPAPENSDLYEALMKSVPGIEIKGATMPYTSINGNMYSFLKEGQVGLRLPEKEREAFCKKFNTGLFETYGTVMKEYVTIPVELMKKTKALMPFILISHAYTKGLKPKPGKK